jgi:hypothetical protein
VLEGSVRAAAQHLRVTGRLLDAARGAVLWSQEQTMNRILLATALLCVGVSGASAQVELNGVRRSGDEVSSTISSFQFARAVDATPTATWNSQC